MAKHHLSHEQEVKGGEHSHSHHHKMIKHHVSELHKMAKNGSKHHEKEHITAHDRSVDKKNLSKVKHK